MNSKIRIHTGFCVGFHWLSVLMLMGLFMTGSVLAWMGQSPAQVWLGEVHMWMGLGLLGVTFGRLGWAVVVPGACQLRWSQRVVWAAVIVASVGGLGLWLMPTSAVNGQLFFGQICLALIMAHLIGVFYYQERANQKKQVFSIQ